MGILFVRFTLSEVPTVDLILAHVDYIDLSQSLTLQKCDSHLFKMCVKLNTYNNNFKILSFKKHVNSVMLPG